MSARITLAVRDAALARHLTRLLARPDAFLETVKGASRVWDRIRRDGADLVVVSQSMIPRPQAQAIGAWRAHSDSSALIVISDNDDPQEQAELLAAGCNAVLHRGLSINAFRDAFDTALRTNAVAPAKAPQEGRRMEEARLADFNSQNPAMQSFLRVAERVVASDVSLLILGETGVGKEHLARAIHAEGPRADGPFIAVNCGAMPESLLESELFGHEKGSFTGAFRARRGWFEVANGGTVFLDEIGEMPYHLQVKLLRVLQDHEVQRVGAEKAISVDVRVMAASNGNLEADVAAANFRRDLYYRLCVVTLTVPPLREHREAIPALVRHYLNCLRRTTGSRAEGVTEEAMQALLAYAWPGNVRELINVIERAMLLCNAQSIALEDLPPAIRQPGSSEPVRQMLRLPAHDPGRASDGWLQRPWRAVRQEALDDLERAYVAGLLRATGGRVGKAAKAAGIGPRSLYDKMRRHALRWQDFRPPNGA